MHDWPNNLREDLMLCAWDFNSDNLEEISLEKVALAFHQSITPKEREMIRFKYREDKSFEEIDNEFGLEEGYSMDIVVRALSKMRTYLRDSNLIEKGLFDNMVRTENLLLRNLDLKPRIINVLERYQVMSMKDLSILSVEELTEMRNIGSGSIAFLTDALSKMGVSTQTDDPYRPYIVDMPIYARSLNKEQTDMSKDKERNSY